MNRDLLLKSICKEVLVASELFIDNLHCVVLKQLNSPVFLQDLIEDIVLLSSFKSFQVTDTDIMSTLVSFINNPHINQKFIDMRSVESHTEDELRGVSNDVFSNIALKYDNFRDIKPKFFAEYEDQALTTSIIKLDSIVKTEKFSGSSEFNKLHPYLRKNLFPTTLTRKHLTSGNCFFILYIDCIVRYSNVRYMEILATDVKKMSFYKVSESYQKN
ncbi:hypothetical protein LMH73_015645 [Vibrio splendidus]|nr:hypothetical protein [Vibrio splendidus]MCC4881478.1 hypothetical protein [Vibrio splendidus]